ncbi:MAG: class I SAM-dependent methyltransferase [Candidatus Hodarchaeota archaeon]
MNKAEKLAKKVTKECRKPKVRSFNPWLRKVYEQRDTNTRAHDFWEETVKCNFYKWLSCLIKALKPMVVVEMGADYGGSAVFILSELPEEGKLYSIDIRGDERHIWQYVPKWDNRIIKLTGDDTNLDTYPTNFPWKEVDFWFVDSDHSWEHVESQMNLIRPHIKEGTVILIHDIYLNEKEVAKKLKGKYPNWDWWEDEKKIFGNGIGMFVI